MGNIGSDIAAAGFAIASAIIISVLLVANNTSYLSLFGLIYASIFGTYACFLGKSAG
jgi:hypothetical protein